MAVIKILILAAILTAIETTGRWINRARKDAITQWPAIRRAWILMIFEVGILATWIALAIFDLRPPIDPVRIAGNLWRTISGR